MSEGVLILESGLEFGGRLFGAPTSAELIRASTKVNSSAGRDRGYGEVVFNTSLTGYQEILTDPSYYGQIICMTNPHIGNTGTNEEDPESAHPWCGGLVINQLCSSPSSWRNKLDLNSYLVAAKVPGIEGVDTRALTRHLRSTGVTRGLILPISEKNQAKSLFAELPPFEGRDLIDEVSTPKSYKWERSFPPGNKKIFRVIAMDFGLKKNLLHSLAERGCEIEVVPAKTSAKDILDKKPDGVFLSNGPGDPKAAPYAAETVKNLIGRVPVFGVCMGHQIMALALGAKTYKLKFGHRGGNQPVIDRTTGKVEISSHNHGYSVDGTSLPAMAEVTHTNLNDKTVEGIRIRDAKAFSVQYHPEACPGPHDSVLLFDRFIDMMK
ncbi:MAG: glutamine-hydrolyzing carbamoyl-phosphate synthase small subunit [Bdellovibrionota bacterium]